MAEHMPGGYRRQEISQELGIESTNLVEDPDCAYTAIPIRIKGNPEETSAILASKLEEVVNLIEEDGTMTVPKGYEHLYALETSLRVGIAMEQAKVAARASRQ